MAVDKHEVKNGSFLEDKTCFAFVEQVRVKDNVILDKFHLDLSANNVITILGPSGAGKTSLLSLLTDNVPSNATAKANLSSNLPGNMAIVPQGIDCTDSLPPVVTFSTTRVSWGCQRKKQTRTLKNFSEDMDSPSSSSTKSKTYY